jgi:eukaryotic-like serine/threonine-protein kinase
VTAPGTTVAGRYRVLRRLGAGGMGSVWLARDTSLNREVAVKSVLAEVGDGGGTPGRDGLGDQRAMREARLVARINHPHAVAIYDVVTHEQQPWLVMEYVPSQNLSQVVHEQGPLPPRRAAELGVQVASALVDAHRAGIVHRDVKPANVLISEHGSAKLTDFGIARGHDDVTLTATGALWGTPAYFAPEVATGSSPTEKADVWSLGATLYFAVDGAPPYGVDGGPLVLLGRIAHQPVPPPTRAGPLTSVLARLLDRDPDSRPAMAEAAQLLRLDRPGYDETRAIGRVPPLPPGVPGQRPRPVTERASGRRAGALLAAVTVLALLGMAGLGWLLLAPDDGEGANPVAEAPAPTAGAAPPPSAAPSSAPSTPTAQDAGTTPRSPSGHRSSAGRGRGAFAPAAMEQTVADYYALMPRDTERGFALLGPGLRAQGFDAYDEFWDSIDSARVRNLQARPGSRTVTATVVFVTDDGRTSTEQHRFGLVPDRSGDGLLIDTDDLVG